jgi:hypothetical protein
VWKNARGTDKIIHCKKHENNLSFKACFSQTSPQLLNIPMEQDSEVLTTAEGYMEQLSER